MNNIDKLEVEVEGLKTKISELENTLYKNCVVMGIAIIILLFRGYFNV